MTSWYHDTDSMEKNPVTTAEHEGGAYGRHEKYEIQIDRKHYPVEKDEMTGEELRQVPAEPIGLDRDLFKVVPGKPDEKVELTTVVKIRDGKRFFTVPAHINPGRR